MSGGISWRSPSAAEKYRDHDYADFAQEFLNRNASYRLDHAETQDRIAEDPASVQKEEEGLAGRWGLSFPHLAGCRSTHQPRTLVTTCRTRRGGTGNSRHRSDPIIAGL
ncbi:transcriptional regulator domain-containing protein [Pararhizobium sp.]|uniref:transcriptional regulator domain-containing protein n=1 Tax=Pararhizobium sp. TaxID=1977563 RepID=UPI0039C9399A